ncbi:MAG: DNA repair protein RadA [Bdellovibrionales bacterium GWA2_49_15]|nr:MAG: DNA repair protein RadA [Bdellovibrionales bacterium GWA2_49_15]
MSKKNVNFVCTSCTYQTPKWMGRCPECGQWNSFSEETESFGKIAARKLKIEDFKSEVRELAGFSEEIGESLKIKTGILEFDRVLGGGITKSSFVLIGGEPGIGKSTLLLMAAGKVASVSDEKLLYVSGEESGHQVNQRAQRLKINAKNIHFLNDCSIEKIKTALVKLRPKFLIIDSIQTIYSEEIDSPPGTVTQIREVTYQLMTISKQNGITTFVVGHVTKEGNIAGPKMLEHMVDCVIYFEGDSLNNYRFLRCIKNRFGNTNEVGIFQMAEDGLEEVPNPSKIFLAESIEAGHGRSLTCLLEGTRPLVVETQALVVENKFGNGRRITQGLDLGRLNLLIAIIEKYFKMPVSYNDIYVNIVGGLKLSGRDSDLSIIASIVSSFLSKPIINRSVFLGEVGLTGEVRSVQFTELRVKEIALMNYKKLICSTQAAQKLKGHSELEIIGITNAVEIRDIFS